MGENEIKASLGETMRKFFSMLGRARLPYVWIVAYIVVSMFLANVGLEVTEYTAEMFAGNVSLTGVILPFILFTVVSLVISSISGIVSGICTARIDRNLRWSLWERVVHLPFSFYQDIQPKEMISRITTDVAAVSQLVMQVFVEFVTTLYSSVLIFQRIYSYNYKLMLALFVILPLQVIIAVLAGQMQFGLGNKVNQARAGLTQGVAERIGQSLLIKSFGTEEKEERNIGARMKEFYQVSMKNSWVSNLVTPVYAIAGAIQFILIVLVGRGFYADGEISLAQWVAFFAFANQLMNILTTYTGYWTSLRAAQGSTLRISDVMSQKGEDISEGADAKALEGNIEFRDVSFGFGKKPLFEHLNLTIPRGQMTAIIGKSGSGKTTLLNLIHRLYPPGEGKICIGGEDIETFNKKSYRSLVTYITQEAVLFSGTIRENLVMGLDREVADGELDEICKKLGLDEFIQSLPLLYDTPLSESGSNLSGGQMQKLAIARAFLRQTDYLLIDEGTAALDVGAKDQVWKAVREKMAGRTVAYVAHNRQAVSQADYVIVMGRGKIEDQGTFAEMREKNKYLKELLESDEGGAGGEEE